MNPSPQKVTELLRAWRNGDRAAADELMPLVYDELRRIAKRQLARHPGHALQTTTLVNEACARLLGQQPIAWQDRAHFLAYCANVMRNILVDHFRKHRPQVSLSEAEHAPREQNVDVLRLHEALGDLAKLDPRASRVVELKFFGGLTMEEIAEVLDIAIATVNRDWREAKRWLKAELEGGPQQ